jgi:hypothetical protein
LERGRSDKAEGLISFREKKERKEEKEKKRCVDWESNPHPSI